MNDDNVQEQRAQVGSSIEAAARLAKQPSLTSLVP